MPSIILIYPNTGGAFSKMREKRPLPLGLLSTSVYLPSDIKTIIFDQNLSKNWKKDLKKLITRDTVLIGLHAMAGPQLMHCLKLSRYIKKIVPEIPVIWGGVYPSLMPKSVLSENCVDFAVIREGERTLPELVNSLLNNKDVSKVKGLYIKKNKDFIYTGSRPFLDLNILPELPYHLLNIKEYNVSAAYRYNKNEMKLQIETSRGCERNCIFCYNPVYSKRNWRYQNSKKILERIDYLVDRYKMTHLDFIDDAFFTDDDRIVNLANTLIDKRYNIKWFVQGADADRLYDKDKSYFKMLEKSGCRILRMGAESGSSRLLDNMNKQLAISGLLKLNRMLNDFKIEPWYYFTIGMEGESKEDLQASIALMFQLLKENKKARIVSAFCLTPQVGTALLVKAKKAGFEIPNTVSAWAGIDGSEIITPWFTKKEKKLMNFIFFTSLFMDKKNRQMIDSLFFRTLSEIYRPLAVWRMKNFFFHIPLEYKLFEVIKKISSL